jgi:hypothetical protein
MRCFLAGIFLLITLAPSAALAEPRGEVESIGFGSLYRPNCHVPMVVRVQADKSGSYQIRVVQDDLDADQPLFTQRVSLTGAEEGKGSEQRFWIYFMPQPTEGGLPDVTRGGNLRDLQQSLKVFLCDENGKQIIQLPVTQTIQNVEGASGGPLSTPRGTKLILAVSDGAAQPTWRDYQAALGTMEDIVFVTLRATDLPEDVRGYEAVDGIIWLNAPAPDPSKPADERRHHALREYVHDGGHLVICQPPQRDATAAFDDLMPVTVPAVAPRDNLEPLRTIATSKRPVYTPTTPTADSLEDELRGPRVDDWSLPRGPFMFARGVLKPGAIAEEMIKWNADGSDSTPYIARGGYGSGCVTWVAHDLSDPAITARAKSGWPFVWDRVLDFKHELTIIDNRTTDEQKRPYAAAGTTMDIGHGLLKGMELTSKSTALVSIAVVFFIAYWVVAGPGVYLYLLTKSRPQLSWFLFAFSALVATVLTVLIVRLVVRGAPEMAHVTLVRASEDDPLTISRFGLYIPRDGAQEIAVQEVAPKAVSYLTAYPRHPGHSDGDIKFPAHMQYVVPIRDATSDEPVKLSVPYRSTLKQFQARRVGGIPGAIEGAPKLRETEAGYNLEGVLLNGTQWRLKNVYFVYHDPSEGREDDLVFFLPIWEKGQSINLADEFSLRSTKFIGLSRDAGNLSGYPEQKIKLRGVMGTPGSDLGWSRYWFSSFRSSGFAPSSLDDLNAEVSKSLPMMSVFSRLPPMKNGKAVQPDRVDVLRRGGRYLDVSPAIAAGRLVIIAEAAGSSPVPFALEVDGDKVAGKGTILYQRILALNRVPMPPATQPATQPAAGGSKATGANVGLELASWPQ